MKKALVLLLVLVLCFCMTAAVFADNVNSPENNPVTEPQEPQSPQTGVANVLYWVLGAAAVCVLGAAVVIGKAKSRA